MTTNQIAYFKAKVEERHYNNLDAESKRHNVATEQLGVQELAETQRSNQAREALNLQTLQETIQHNRTTEQQTWASLRLQESLNASQIALNEANATLRSLESDSKSFQNYLDQTYGEIERVLGSSGKGGSSGSGIVPTVAKVITYVTTGQQTGVPDKGSASQKLAGISTTKKVTNQQLLQIAGSRLANSTASQKAFLQKQVQKNRMPKMQNVSFMNWLGAK